MSQNSTVQAESVARWVTFRLEEELYGIDVMQIREVLRCPEVSPVPGAPAFVLGIINLRGSVVAIIDTRSRFNLPPREVDDNSRILILDAGEHMVGYLVDGVSEVAELQGGAIEQAPDTGRGDASRFITGLYNCKAGLLILLDASRMLTEEELAELSVI